MFFQELTDMGFQFLQFLFGDIGSHGSLVFNILFIVNGNDSEFAVIADGIFKHIERATFAVFDDVFVVHVFGEPLHVLRQLELLNNVGVVLFECEEVHTGDPVRFNGGPTLTAKEVNHHFVFDFYLLSEHVE